MIGALGAAVLIGTNLPNKKPSVEPTNKNCEVSAEPVVALDFGSRYTGDSKDRADLSEAGNDAVNKALAPVDRFVQDLARGANAALADQDDAAKNAACVFDAVYDWANADALSDLQSTNAKLSSPSRIGGIAAAYAQIAGLTDHDRQKQQTIHDWLTRRAEAIVTFFENEAPQKAAQNNLRGWAGFAVGEIGIITQNSAFTNWATATNSAMIASANADGSLPLEMGRGKYALHYQLHATSALAGSMARLCDGGIVISAADLAGLDKIAGFSLRAINAPEIVEQLNGHQQKIDEISPKKTSAIAWVEAYAALKNRDEIVPQDLRPLSNSKLGGNLTQLYSGKTLKCNAPNA